jgi:hypothetical protein
MDKFDVCGGQIESVKIVFTLLVTEEVSRRQSIRRDRETRGPEREAQGIRRARLNKLGLRV